MTAGPCFYCNRTTLTGRRAARNGRLGLMATKDHIVPRCHPEFPGDLGNIVRACFRCNQAKAECPADLFLAFAIAELRGRHGGTVSEVKAQYRRWLLYSRTTQVAAE